MPRMIEVIRQSALPSNVMQFAAKGALLVPPTEMIEILVYLALHNRVFGEQARMTLAGWDEVSALQAAADPKTPSEVLEYFIDPANLRPALLPALLENPSVKESSIATMARRAIREQIELLLKSERVNRSTVILQALLENARTSGPETHMIRERLAKPEPKAAEPAPEATTEKLEAAQEEAPPPEPPQQETATEEQAEVLPHSEESIEDGDEEALKAYLSEHAAEIVAEAGKAFQPIGGVYEESESVTESDQAEPVATAQATIHDGAAAAPRRAAAKKWILSSDEQRGTALQKIAKLDIKGRIQLAMKGNKEERSLLVRDGTKIVALAVLDSPKLTDGEVEKFAGQKNVLEAVLRAIPMKRRFMKLYPVVRNLCFNPRTPIDVALGLIKNLLTQDLRHLSGNKEVSDTVRKLALKMFRQKLDVTKKS